MFYPFPDPGWWINIRENVIHPFSDQEFKLFDGYTRFSILGSGSVGVVHFYYACILRHNPSLLFVSE
jgi:hypothetical protein